MAFTLISGAYTISEAARVLGVEGGRLANLAWRHWWGSGYAELGDVRSLDFYTLMELKTYLALRDAGVSARRIHAARRELMEDFDRDRPFARRDVLASLKTDGSKIYFEIGDDTVALNGSKQLNLTLIREFVADIEFGDDGLAQRYTPPSAGGNVVLDPEIRLGRPTVKGTRVEAAVLAQMYQAGDPYDLIADAYDLPEDQVRSAVEYAMAA